MFTVFNCFTPESWKGHVKRGFVGENTGVRFCQHKPAAPERKFNEIARRGGMLDNILKENRFPFYIDRLQGGCWFESYDYDKELIAYYNELLGDKFYGLQMHEWMGNIQSDLERIKVGGIEEWTEEGIEKAILSHCDTGVYTESMSVKELASEHYCTDWRDFLDMANRLFKKRSDYARSRGTDIIVCDSIYPSPMIEIPCGVKRIMPEIGAQTWNTRVQMAYARGTARGAGIEFGAYYEPWGGKPLTAAGYNKDGVNEWSIGPRYGGEFPWGTKGENGGSSRSLQKRMYLYAYLSGAKWISEEWDLCNTFYDFRDFEVTPYGKIKLELLDFVRKFHSTGELYAPIAIVVPNDLETLEMYRFNNADKKYINYDASGERDKDVMSKLSLVRSGIGDIMCKSNCKYGNETMLLKNTDLPDMFDIVNEKYVNNKVRYEYYVDLTGGQSFAKNYSNICNISDLSKIADKLMPCKVSGGVHWFVNKGKDADYLTIFNNDGIERTLQYGDRKIPEAVKTCVAECKNGKRIEPLYGNYKFETDGDKAVITLEAGEIFFGKLV